MRSGVIYALLVLLIRRDGSGAADDFRPTPIPLNEWHEVRGGRMAGPREQARPSAPPRYWEDALRHSVYLTLVRDKIDRIIATGNYDDQSKEIDDRDLWDKVKRAPFQRTEANEPTMFGDVAIMAKGKLMEDHHSFRFAEDDKFEDRCAHDKCMDGVKALWSVKRERQRDAATVPGQYHYELTFSVITQPQKKHKPHEKPARTFTVRESVPEKIVETPKEPRYYEPVPIQAHTSRPERAIWFHKNIAPIARNQARQHQNGLDRLFSSLFTDDDEELPHPRYKPKHYIPSSYQQYSKVGYVGSPSEHQQKKFNPYGQKPYSHKHSRPIPPPPPQSHSHHHYLDIDAIGVVSNPYTQDHRYGPLHKHSKTQRPPVLPTPPNPVLPQKNFTIETTTKVKPNTAEETTHQPEHVNTHKTHTKQKPTTIKISYTADHVRPPVYNAPPGVFVTMDKKPFKPMPPLRLVHSSKLHKTPRPTDFRPSPQVLDIQFSEPDPLFDTAFRPITVNYANNNTTEKAVVAASDSHFRKSNTTTKKPPKKHDIQVTRVTTPTPEIITAHTIVDSEAEWTNVLGAFAKTTPMAADKEKTVVSETTTPLTTSTTITTSTKPVTTTFRKRVTTTTTEAPTTTPKPKKRTRPPPKFTKPEKVKKHKRVTTTTTTEAPEKPNKSQDLTPQASSAAATPKLPSSTSTSTTTSTTTTTTTTQATTTPVQTTTTTTQPTTTTLVSKPTPKPESDHIKRKNRYRQSTLKYRSTSSKDDKKEDKPRTILPPTGNFPPRRKGSKFQGHIPSSTPKNTDKQYDEEGREDHVVSPYKSKMISTTESLTAKPGASTETTQTTTAYEGVVDHIYITSESPDYFQSQEEESDLNSDDMGEEEQESIDHSVFMSSTAAMAATPSEKTNEIIEIDDEASDITEDIAVTTPKNKSKCKKKKHHNLTNTTEETKPETTEPATSELAEFETSTTTSTTTTTTTETAVTPDIFQEIFGGFTFDDSPEESKNNESTSKLLEQETINQEQFVKAEEDFEDFFEAFDDKDRHPDGKFEDQYEYDDQEPVLGDNESLFQSEDDRRSPRDSEDDEAYEDYQERPFSLLELMAME